MTDLVGCLVEMLGGDLVRIRAVTFDNQGHLKLWAEQLNGELRQVCGSFKLVREQPIVMPVPGGGR